MKKKSRHHQMTTDPEGYQKKWHDYFHKKEHRVGKYSHPSKRFSENYDKIDWKN